MKILLAVIDDLLTFAISPFVRRRSKDTDSVIPLIQTEVPYNVPQSPEQSSSEELVSEVKVDDIPVSSFRSTADVLEKGSEEDIPLEYNTVMYVGTHDAPLYIRPTIEFDGVIKTLKYGTLLMAIKKQGRWAEVLCGTTRGWILREDLVDRAAHVYPDLQVGMRYGAEEPATIRLRALIEDEFSLIQSDTPLCSEEYVTYRLIRKGLTISWGEVRPRMAGTWNTLLKGVVGVTIGVRPKTGALMEHVDVDGEGHLSYVEAVFPDETISVSTVSHGVYETQELTAQSWQALAPVFIQVT